MNIWYVQPTAGGPGLARQWRSYWLAHYWQAAGHRVTVVTASYHHLMDGEPRSEGPELVGGVPHWFVQVPRYRGNGIGRVVNMLALGPGLRRAADRIRQDAGRPDVVIASSPHIFAVRDALAVARRFDAHFWLEVRDIWPQTLVELNQAHRWNPLVLWAGWIERSAYRSADRVISALRGAEAHMLARGLRPGRFVWAPNGVADEDLEAAARVNDAHPLHALAVQVRQWREQGNFVLVHAGAMGPPQGLEYLLDAFALLQQQGIKARLLLVGDGVSRMTLAERVRMLGLRNVDIQVPVPRPAVGDILRECDAAVLSLQPSRLWRHGISPNKLFDYCLFARRVLATCEPDALQGLEQLPVMNVPAGDAEGIARAIRLLASEDPPDLDAAAAAARLQPFRLRAIAERVLADSRLQPAA